jgi:hypothetical protein
MNFSNVVALGQSLVPFFTDRDYPSLAFLLPTIGLLLKLESNERSEKLESNTASSLEWALYSPTNTIPQLFFNMLPNLNWKKDESGIGFRGCCWLYSNWIDHGAFWRRIGLDR